LPHVVLRGSVGIDPFNHVFKPVVEEKKEWLIKIEEIYLERSGLQAIVPAVVVEEGHAQTFYIRLSMPQTGGRLSIRLDPLTDPIKTRGVKRSIALLAEVMLGGNQEFTIERHNLQGYFSGDPV